LAALFCLCLVLRVSLVNLIMCCDTEVEKKQKSIKKSNYKKFRKRQDFLDSFEISQSEVFG